MTGLGQVLAFEVVGARVEPFAAVPTIVLRLRIAERGDPGGAAAPDPVPVSYTHLTLPTILRV